MPDRETPMAGCPGCRAPLISTFAFSGSEFYCLECGRHVTFFGPVALNAAEHQERYDALKAEWDEHAGANLLVRGSYLESCERCRSGRAGDHPSHATDEEIAANRSARAWLTERAAA